MKTTRELQTSDKHITEPGQKESEIKTSGRRVRRPAPPTGTDASAQSTTLDLDSPEIFINRELSWLEFNARVLEEASDPNQPLLERTKFLLIFNSNLDEFFEIRVSGVKQQIENGEGEDGEPSFDGLTPLEVFRLIRARVLELVADQYTLWNSEIKPALAAAGIVFLEMNELSEEDSADAGCFFNEEVLPVLTPLALDPAHPFPQLANKSHNLIVQVRHPARPNDSMLAIVQIPRILNRLVSLKPGPNGETRFVFLKSLIKAHVGNLFPGLEVLSSYGFRITRNSDLYLDEEEIENLLKYVEEELRKRSRGDAVRLEIEPGMPPEVLSMLLGKLDLAADDCYALHGPLSFTHLAPLVFSDFRPDLKDRPFVPIYPAELPAGCDTFEVLRKRDVLVHHPFETFNTLVDFLNLAAADPSVLAIKLTLYRTSGDSPVLHALINAARVGKQVTALMEIKARFDEANNINWARKLEEAGVNVVYGIVGLKTHSKLLLIVRRDKDCIRRYAHIGTGNYHPSTARIYTDLGLLTTNDAITSEVAATFNKLTGLSEFRDFEKLLVAPWVMARRCGELIRREADNARLGRPARIILKMNSLVDPGMIRELYKASIEGVKIDLIVRGICCLRPGLPGVSENIRVISIVGRFLEHSRILWFQNDNKPEVFIGSADWMPRNLYRRVEVAVPIEDQRIKERITNEILAAYLADCVKARELLPDGSYKRLHPQAGQEPQQAQLTFRRLARKAARGGCDPERD